MILFCFPKDSLQKYTSDLLDISVEEILPYLMEQDLVSTNDVVNITDKSQPASDRKQYLVYSVILRFSEPEITKFLEYLLKCRTVHHEQLHKKITAERYVCPSI